MCFFIYMCYIILYVYLYVLYYFQFFLGMPGASPVSKESDDLIPPIVLAIIFGLFVIVLIISLYCFCRRRKRRYHGNDDVFLATQFPETFRFRILDVFSLSVTSLIFFIYLFI